VEGGGRGAEELEEGQGALMEYSRIGIFSLRSFGREGFLVVCGGFAWIGLLRFVTVMFNCKGLLNVVFKDCL
jgi:hypothetical protein